MTDKEINKKIQDMIKLPKTSNKRILAFVKKKECQAASLTPSTLGMLFEIYAGIRYDAEDATTCFSRAITVEELEKVHPNFRSTNGCQWARSDASYLGKRYKIKREHKNGKVYGKSGKASYDTAFAMYSHLYAFGYKPSDELTAYIRRVGKKIVEYMIESNRTQDAIRLISFNILTSNALKSLHESAVQKNCAEIAAYLMEAIRKSGKSTSMRL